MIFRQKRKAKINAMKKDLKVMAKFTTNLTNIVSSTFLIGALALSGCGGGGSGDSGQVKGQAAGVNPSVITNDAAQVLT